MVTGLAKAAKLHKLPVIVTTTARDSMWGPTFPELVEALPGIEIIDRATVNAFDDARVFRAIETTGRKKLIFAGISLWKSVCRFFPRLPRSAGAWTRMLPARCLRNGSWARPNARSASCVCCRQA